MALFTFVADLVSKLLIVAHIDPARPVSLLGGFLHIVNTRNPGAAFSIGTGTTWIFALVATVVVVVIVRSARRLRSIGWGIGLGLLLGGALGNLTDRILRSPGVFRGYVVDWIQLPHFAIFNLADSGITCGAVLLGLLAIRGIEMDGRRTKKSGTTTASPGVSP